MRRCLLLLVTLLLAAAPAQAEVHPDATWSEHYFESFDGTRLHADVLRPKHLPADAKTPVVLTVSPYTNHLAEATTIKPQGGPSNRFYDFVNDTDLLKQGYTYVIVDLRGFGGSAGCNDWGGPGERGDTKAAVEWAASQSWSSGKVALLGKSYDAWTGLMGLVEQPEGLAGVISMEPVYSGYLYGYSNRVRFSNSVVTPTLFTAIDTFPGHPADSVDYHVNGNTRNPACYALNIGQQQQEEEDAPFWVQRDLVKAVKGVADQAPVFLMQGFLEANTKPEKAFEFWNSLTHPGSRAWFGQFDHVRGNEKQGQRWATGRATFAAEALRFLDEHLKGVAPAVRDPKVAVQDADGRWRAEAAWPPADAREATFPGPAGTYADDNGNRGTGSGGGKGLWSISQPLPHEVHLAGPGTMRVSVANTVPRANLVGNVYDIDPEGVATLVSRGAFLLDGRGTVEFETYGQDWRLPAGHRIGVLVSGSNSEWYTHVPTRQEVRVTGSSWTAPFLARERTSFLDGESTPRLEQHRGQTFRVPEATIAAAETTFPLPGPLERPKAKGPKKQR
jgi:uncharacterized protein